MNLESQNKLKGSDFIKVEITYQFVKYALTSSHALESPEGLFLRRLDRVSSTFSTPFFTQNNLGTPSSSHRFRFFRQFDYNRNTRRWIFKRIGFYQFVQQQIRCDTEADVPINFTLIHHHQNFGFAQ